MAGDGFGVSVAGAGDVNRDGFSMQVFSKLKRTARFLMSAPYLWFGHLLYSRQSRVFGRCDPVTSDLATNRD